MFWENEMDLLMKLLKLWWWCLVLVVVLPFRFLKEGYVSDDRAACRSL